ncbi:hypothetical protein ACFL1T_05075, partial [Chlamydiota bacterium]
DQVYEVWFGAAKNIQTTTSGTTTNIDGALIQSNSTTLNTYDTEYGLLVESTGTSVSVSSDMYDNKTTTETIITSEIYLGSAKQIETTSTSNTENRDGSYANTWMTTTYYYDEYGHGLYGYGEGTSWSNAVGLADSREGDQTTTAVMGTTTGTIQQWYSVYEGQFKLVKTYNYSETDNTDGSQSEMEMTTTYSYDEHGYILGAEGLGHSWSNSLGLTYNEVTGTTDEVVISETVATIVQTYTVVAGMAKLESSVNESHTVSGEFITDGSLVGGMGDVSATGLIAETTSTMTMTYEYYGEEMFNTVGEIYHEEGTPTVYLGQIKSADGDGTSFSKSYEYISGADLTLTVVSETTSTIDQTFTVHTASGKTVLQEAVTESHTINADASEAGSTLTVTYGYNPANGLVVSATGEGTSWSTSKGYDYLDDTMTEGAASIEVVGTSEGTINQTYAVVLGKNVVIETVNDSTTTNVDNSTVQATATVNYSYNSVGFVTGATGSSESEGVTWGLTYDGGVSTLGITATTETTTDTQVYQLYYGSAKVIYQKSVSTTENIDGSQAGSVTDMNNVYDKVGHLMEATGSGQSWSNSVGYIHYDATATTPDTTTTVVSESTGTITQTYTVGYGKARIIESISEVSTINNDGSIAYSEMTTTYGYGEFGLLISAHGSGYSTSNGYGYEYISEDGTGTIGPSIMNTTTANIDQSYAVIYGSAKVLDSHSISHTENADGTYSDTDMNTTYSYTWNGLVDGATGDGTTSTFSVGYIYVDENGADIGGTGVISQTVGTIDQTYTVIFGQAKLWQSDNYSYSVTGSFDPITGDVVSTISTSESDVTTIYSYNINNGLLQDAVGDGTSTGLSWGWEDEAGGVLVVSTTSMGSSHQRYEIFFGGAKVIESTSDSTSVNRDGS